MFTNTYYDKQIGELIMNKGANIAYVRVSTIEQNETRQINAIKE